MEHTEEVQIALAAFNAVYKNIEDRSAKIQNNKNNMKELKSYVDQYEVLEIENKELKKDNDKDRAWATSTIEFYEKQSGEAVGVGGLFEQENET